MSAWLEGVLLFTAMVLCSIQAGRFGMSGPLAFTLVACYTWLMWLILSGLWFWIF